MHDRPINYLIEKYKTKQPGETWERDTELEYIQDYRLKQKIFQLEIILNQLHGNFKITKEQKQRIIHILKETDFDKANLNTEQIIVMIIIYVKLETHPYRQFTDYQNLIQKYELTSNTFIRFLVDLTQQYIQRKPLPYTPNNFL